MIEFDKHLTPEQIAMCADAINSDSYSSLPEAIRLHLEECDECAAEVTDVAEMSLEIDRLVRSKKKGNMLKIRLLYSVSAVAAVALIFFVFRLISEYKSEVPNIVQLSDSLNIDKIEPKKDSINHVYQAEIANSEVQEAQNKMYLKNENLEILVNNFKDSYRSNEIEIISKSEIFAAMPCTLRWVNSQSQELRFELFNNQGNLVFETITTSNKVVVNGFPKGLYYWKLIDNDFNLLFVGKIKNQ